MKLSTTSILILLQLPTIFGSQLRSAEDAVSSRGLAMDAFAFSIAGISVDAETAQTECPSEWTSAASCVITDCPNFVDVCPDSPEGEVLESRPCLCQQYDTPGCCLMECFDELCDLTTCLLRATEGTEVVCTRTPDFSFIQNHPLGCHVFEEALVVSEEGSVPTASANATVTLSRDEYRELLADMDALVVAVFHLRDKLESLAR